VVAATRHEQTTGRAPSSVSIVTGDEIRQLGYRTLADVLRGVRGFYTTSDRSYGYLGARGFGRPSDYNSRVLLLVDGQRLNDSLYDGALLGTECPLDLDVVERVEVVRGPGSSLYGNNAFFGVVNLITRQGRDLDGVEFSGEAGSADTYKGIVSVGKKFANGIEGLASGSYYTSGGLDGLSLPGATEPGLPTEIGEGMDADAAYRGFLKLSYSSFSFEGVYGRREKTVPTASWWTIPDDDRFVIADERLSLSLRFDQDLGRDWGLAGKVGYDLYKYDGEYPYADETLPGGSYLAVDDVQGQRWGTDWMLTKTLADRHRLSLGVECVDDFQLDQEYWDPGLGDFRSYEDRWWVEAYAQAEIEVRTNLLLNLGGRYGYNSQFGATGHPRLALVYQPVSEATLKLLYGSAYRAPNVYELYYTVTPGNVPNPDLEPEEITTYEFVYEQALPWEVRFSSSLYRYEINDLISATEVEGGIRFENLNQAEAYGMEFGLEKRWKNGGLARVSYTLQEAQDGETGKVLSNCPRQIGQAQVIVPIWKDRIHTGLEVIHVDSVETESGRELDAYTLVNVTLFSRNLVKGLEVSASVYNLFDADAYFPVGAEVPYASIADEGRGFRCKLTYRF